jgi:hypothetical protein
MSNGAPNTSNPWAEVRFDSSNLTSVLAVETGAVEDAAGDVRGANVLMAEEVARIGKKISAAKEALADCQQDIVSRLQELGLVGRAIDITSGTSLGFMVNPDDEPVTTIQPAENDLVEVSGIITGFEAGTVFGKPGARPDQIVLHVDEAGGSAASVAVHRYAVPADSAQYTIAEIPQSA